MLNLRKFFQTENKEQSKENVSFVKKVSALIEVRKIIALVVTWLFIYLAVKGRINSEFIEYVIVSVISYYFAKSTALDIPKKEEKKPSFDDLEENEEEP